MKREERNALSRTKILNVAMREFSAKGYEGASLNTVWAENAISKGIIYHYFKDKDELYLLCVNQCFEELTAYLKAYVKTLSGTPAQQLGMYFAARAHFFAENPLHLGIFCDAVFQPPVKLETAIADCRRDFDALNISVLTMLLCSAPLRDGVSVAAVVEDFKSYMDFFNWRFKAEWKRGLSPEEVWKEHEEKCCRQVDILLHGVLK